jgi:hypothetical protein
VAILLPIPKFQFADSTGRPYAGGSLTFYLTSTVTPEDVYPNENLTSGVSTVTLNAAGWPSTDVFLHPEKKYKVVLKDASANVIWTVDPVSTTDLARVPLWTTTAGDPNGSVAGTAASSGVLPSMVWDRTNSLMYVCTTTGNAAAAVWTALNASSATPVVTAPQGYLTLTSQTPIITSDVTGATAVYYTPFTGNLAPVYNGSRMVPTTFSELTLTLVASHAANTLYDIFLFSNSGVLTLATGPGWTTSTAGSCARGTGASTTELTRLAGYWVNAVQITGRNGSTTYTIPANTATYLGSIFMDGSNGQVTCHRSWGQSRKWGIWNAYNRQPLYLKAGDSTASWTYATNTIRASNNASTNSVTVFCGLAEEFFDLSFTQDIESINIEGAKFQIGIGWNSTSTMSGRRGYSYNYDDNSTGGASGDGADNAFAQHLQAPSLGRNDVTALEVATNAVSPSAILGTETYMMLSARWRG